MTAMGDVRFPRMVVVDATRIGSLSATGQVKERLFSGWPDDRLMQVYRVGERLGLKRSFEDSGGSRSAEEIEAALRSYDPELFYVRPLPEPQHFYEFGFELLERFPEVPVVTHMMDDWPARLAATTPEIADEVDLRLRELLERSSDCFSISKEMSVAYWQRYGTRFEPFANFLDPVDTMRAVPDLDRADPSLLIRYSGGLADDMSSDSLGMLADAVERFEGDVRLEMSILPAWFERARERFADYEHITVEGANRSHHEYWGWLTQADVNVLAYNFDSLSQSYVGFSMANKLPDYLGVGRPILAIGPAHIPTLRVVRDAGAGVDVISSDSEEIVRAISLLADDANLRSRLGAAGRQYALRNLSGPVVRTRFQRRLIAATGANPSGLSYLGHSSARGLRRTRPIERGPMPKSARKPRSLEFEKKRSGIRRVYSLRPEPTIRNMARMVAAPFKGKLGIPALIAGAGFAVALILAAIGAHSRLVQAALALSGGISVLAITSAVARLRVERSLYGRRVEEAVQKALDSAAEALHRDAELLHRELSMTNDRLLAGVTDSRRLAREDNRLLDVRLASTERTNLKRDHQIRDANSRAELLEKDLEHASARVKKLEIQIRDANSNARTLEGQLQSDNKRIERIEKRTAEFDRVIDNQTQIEERLDRNAARRIQTELVDRLGVVPAVNAERYQPFSRRLSADELTYLSEDWAAGMGVTISVKEVAYLAHRIGVLEEISAGRLAASAARILTRAVVARAAQAHASSRSEPLRILEIGTLFGIGLAALYEVTHDRGLGVEVTAIDPLEGYYGPGVPDPITGVPVTRQVFAENMSRLHVPDDKWSLVEDFSSPALSTLAEEGSTYHMIVIDGDHTYDGVKGDFEASLSVSAPGAYLVFDDYGSPDWPDVQGFVDSEVRTRTDVQFIATAFGTAVYRVIR